MGAKYCRKLQAAHLLNLVCILVLVVLVESSYEDSFFYGCSDKNGYSAKVDNRILPVFLFISLDVYILGYVKESFFFHK